MAALISLRHRNTFKVQSGYILLEFVIVAAISLILVVWASNELANKSKTLQAQALANWMLVARNGVESYLNQNEQLIIESIKQYGEQNFNQDIKPSWDYLKNEKYLNSAWNNNGPANKQLDYQIELIGECDVGPCFLQALIYTKQAIKNKNNQSDLSFISDWLLAANGQGLVYRTGNANSFTGSGINVSTQNMASFGKNFQDGMLGLLAVNNLLSNQSGTIVGTDDNSNNSGIDTENFLRVADPRNPDFKGNVSIQGFISSESYLELAEGIIIGAKNQINSPCSAPGEININSSFPSLLVCANGYMQVAAYPRAGGYMLNSRNGCQNALGQSTANPVTGACNCPTMHASVQISESGSYTDSNGANLGYICLPQ